MKTGKWFLLIVVFIASFYVGKNFSRIKENLLRKACEPKYKGQKSIKTEVKSDIAPAIDRRTNHEKTKYETRHDIEEGSAEYAIAEAKRVYEKIKNRRIYGAYPENMDILKEGKMYLDDAESYLAIENYQKSSRCAELARQKFLSAYEIACDIESFCTSLEEKNRTLYGYMSGMLPYLGTDEQSRLMDEVSHLYCDAENILYRATSKENLKVAQQKINMAFNLLERIKELGRNTPEE